MSTNQDDLFRKLLKEFLAKGHTLEEFRRFEFSETELQSFLDGGSLGNRELLLGRVLSQMSNKDAIDEETRAIAESAGGNPAQDIHVSLEDKLNVQDTFEADVSSRPPEGSEVVPYPPDMFPPDYEDPEEISRRGPSDLYDPYEIEDLASQGKDARTESNRKHARILRNHRKSRGMTVDKFAKSQHVDPENIRIIESWIEEPPEYDSGASAASLDEKDSSQIPDFMEEESLEETFVTPSPKGSYTSVTRRASREEKGLGVDQEASALATFFRSAFGEFCFVLFGPWGRGKTFLMELVSELLGERHGYRTVWFNAWKYRSTPELWAHLYHAFVDELSKNTQAETVSWRERIYSHFPDSFVKFSLAIRVSIYKHGFFPVCGAVVVSFFAFIPLAFLLDVVHLVLGMFGITWLFYIWHLLRAGKSTANSLLNKYGRLADHRARLGAQALIGDDLKSLLVACMPMSGRGNVSQLQWKMRAFVIVPFFVSVLLLGGVANRMEWTRLDVLFWPLPALAQD